jgi:hypothetical protein
MVGAVCGLLSSVSTCILASRLYQIYEDYIQRIFDRCEIEAVVEEELREVARWGELGEI